MSAAASRDPASSSYRHELERQAQRRGATPIGSIDELQADIFDSEAELTEFLTDLYSIRRMDTA